MLGMRSTGTFVSQYWACTFVSLLRYGSWPKSLKYKAVVGNKRLKAVKHEANIKIHEKNYFVLKKEGGPGGGKLKNK